MSLAAGHVALELEVAINVDGKLRDKHFHWFEGVFQVREGREGHQVVGLRGECLASRAQMSIWAGSAISDDSVAATACGSNPFSGLTTRSLWTAAMRGSHRR